MKKTILVVMAFVFTGVAVLAGLGVGSATVAAQDEQPKVEVQSSQPAKPVTYKYVAQAGDSYTKMARKAVQTYGKKHKVQLTQAGIVFAETNLTQAAGSPQLNEGQAVEVSEATVKEWAEKAKNLTPEQQTAWNFYVQFVDFNTDGVGEAR